LAGLYGSGQTDQPVEAVGLRSGSRPFPIEITLRSHRLNGSSTSLVVVRDITARKEAEAAVEEAHRKIDVMMASVPDSLWSGELLSGGRLLIHYISPVFERITGYPSEPFCQDSRRWYEILHPDDRGMVEAEQQRFYTGQSSSLELEYRILKPDGTQRYVRDRQFIRPGGPGPTRVDGVLVDITEQKRVEQQFKKANRDLSITVKELQARHREVSLLNEMGDLLQSCTTLEDAYTVIARFSSQLFPGQSGALYIFNPSVEQAEIAATWGDRPPARAQMGTQDCWGLRRNRLHIYSEPGTGLRCSHVVRPNNPAYICAPLQAQGELIGLLHVLSDTHPIQERSAQLSETLARQVGLALINLRLRESLRVQATQDALTGLFNRRYMEGTLANMVSGRNSLDSLGLILLDIDRFKHCNDTFGHDAGDTLLMAFGKYLQRMFGSNNIVCRYGGDEFVVVLPGETIEETLKQAERLRSGFRQQRVYHQGELLQFNTLSLGAAAFPLHGATLTDLLRRADAALYEAKSAGGDHVAVARMD
jgi:diguanylate cyclase (GGDEF)-like protein/PAS domain S-box-containing protein